MKKISLLCVAVFVLLGSFNMAFSQNSGGTLSGIDANERQRIKEDLKRELRKELLQAMREEAEVERQKRLEIDRMKEEVRKELINEMKQNASQDHQLRAQLREELLREMRSETQNNSALREEIRRELMNEYRKENMSAEEIRRELKDELRRELVEKGEISGSHKGTHKETKREKKERLRAEDESEDEVEEKSSRKHSEHKEPTTHAEKREARKEAHKKDKEEEQRYRLKFERGRQKGTSFGVMAGINLSNFRQKQETNITSDQLAGFVAGGYMRFSSKVVYFQPEVLYSGKGSNFGFKEGNGDASTNSRLRINSLDIPMMFGLKVLEHRKMNLRIVAGPLVSVFLGTNGDKNKVKDEDFQRLAAGYQAGLGFDLGNLTFDFRYEGSFSNLNSRAGRDGIFEGNNLRNSIFRASVGFRIF